MENSVTLSLEASKKWPERCLNQVVPQTISLQFGPLSSSLSGS